MRMLYNDQIKLGKELQRKIEKLRAENKDPTLPQKPVQSSPRVPLASPSFDMGAYSPRALPSPPPYVRGRMTDSQATVDESFMVLGGRVSAVLFNVALVQFLTLPSQTQGTTLPSFGLEWR